MMANLAQNATNLLSLFHKDVDTRARSMGFGIAGLHMLQQQLSVYANIFKDLSATTRETISTQQKEINREFTPVIERAMVEAYDTCTAEHGPGSYMRMKAAMTSHVDRVRLTMFHESTSEVRNRLSQMIRQVEEDMSNKADEVFVAMRRDYRAVLGGDSRSQGEMMPKWQRMMQRDVKLVMDGAEKIFEEVAGVEVEGGNDETEGIEQGKEMESEDDEVQIQPDSGSNSNGEIIEEEEEEGDHHHHHDDSSTTSKAEGAGD